MKKAAWAFISLIFLLGACSNAGNVNEQGKAVAGTPTQTPSVAPSSSADGQPTKDDSRSGPVKLTLATYFLSDQMKTSVKKYEELHPNVDIELQASLSYGKDLNEAEARREQFLTGTNTAILAGKGPDLIELDILPMESYVNRGLLVNLSDMMQTTPSFQSQDYFTNVLDHAKIGEGLYGMPLYFSLVGLIGDTAAIDKAGININDSNWTWQDFTKTAKQLQQQGELKNALISEPSYMLSELTSENFGQLVKETNGSKTFDSELFASLLNQVKEMLNDGLLFDIIKDGGGRGTTVTQNAKAYFAESTIGSFGDYLLNSFADQTKLYTKPHPHEMGPGGYFTTYGTLGINANSPHKQAAWDFIQFLLSDETQSLADTSSNNHGFPVNKQAYDLQVKQLKQEGKIQTEMHPAAAVNNEKLDQLKSYLTGAVHWDRTPSKINDTIKEEAKAFFSGQKTAEEAAKLVQSKVNLILNE